jgi:hypothetical protein
MHQELHYQPPEPKTESPDPSTAQETAACPPVAQDRSPPARPTPSRPRRLVGSLVGPLLGAVVLLAGVLLWVWIQFGSVNIALAYLRGERLIITPSVLSLGDAELGEERQLSVTLANHTPRDVTIVGGGSSCSCLALDRFPILIPRGQERELLVKVKVSATPGSTSTTFNQAVQYYTDSEFGPILLVQIVARVTGP